MAYMTVGFAPTKDFTDLWKRGIRLFAQEIHGNLPGLGDLLGTIVPEQRFDGCLPFPGDQFDDLFRLDISALRQEVGQRHIYQAGVQGSAAQVGEGDDAIA